MKFRSRLIGILLCIVLLFTQFTVFFASVASAEDKTWAGSWSTPPVRLGYYVGNRVLSDFLTSVSVRTVLKTSVGGEKVRLRFSNRYGTSDLTLAAVRIARTGKMSDTEIIDGTSLPVTFNGKESVTIPAGKTIYSDAVNMYVESFEKISVSVYYESFTTISTGGLINAISYVDAGNRVDEKTFSSNAPLTLTSGTITYNTIPFLCGLDVYGEEKSCIALLGDSTLANESAFYLAEKLYLAGEKNIGVLQESIIGNHLLHDVTGATGISNLYGEAALTRFKEDILEQPGIKAVYVKLGLNDVLHPLTKSMASKVPQPTTDEIIAGYQQMINMAKKAGIKIYFFGRQPWKGYQRQFYGSDGEDLVWTQQAQDVMITLNKWLEYSAPSNGYISSDILKDPKDPNKVYAPYTTDGTHLTPLGAQVLIDAIPDRYLPASKLSSIEKYYKNNGTDILNYTPESKYTKPEPVTAAPTKPSQPTATTKPAPTPSTTSVIVTAPGGAEITEIVLVEVPNAAIVQPSVFVPIESTMNPLVQPEAYATLSTTAKVGIVLFVILTVILIAFGAIYIADKKMSLD